MRKVVFGEPVTAEDIEGLPADSGPTLLVRLGGVLIGRALAERFGQSVVPEITERINVPDGGVDAEYVSPSIDQDFDALGFIGPGRTIFQFKYRDVRPKGRTSALNALRTQLRKDFSRPMSGFERLVLVTNLHLAGAQPHQLRTQLERLPALDGKAIIIWGAAELALRINQSPHLRHLFFTSGGFSTLGVAEEELKTAYQSLGWTSFLGRGDESNRLSGFLTDPTGRIIQVVGERYAGKTRLVLEALKPYGAAVVWAARPESVTVDHFRDLDSADEPNILVVDRCTRFETERLLEAASARRTLKTILIHDGVPSHIGPGKLLVAPLPQVELDRLIAQLLPRAPWMEQSWLRETTRGLPGLTIQIAALLRDARISPTMDASYIQSRLGELVEDRYLAPLDLATRRALTVAALLPVLGVEGERAKEAYAVAKALGLAPEEFNARLHDLRALGLLKTRGRFVEVSPPLLADRLASAALPSPERILAELQLELTEGAFRRFLERFRDLPNARQAVEHILSPDGWFGDLQALIRDPEHFEILAPAAPESALRTLERLLKPLSDLELRASLRDQARRAIVSTLEGLALRSSTFSRAAELLLVLSSAENETWGNNATGVFTALFRWQHPEVAASYADRVDVLQHGARAASPQKRAVVAKAAEMAFQDFALALHHATRAQLPEAPFRPATWEEVRDYATSLFSLLNRLVRDDDLSTRAAALAGLLASAREFVKYSITRDGLAQLGRSTITTLVELGSAALDAGDRARVVSELELLEDDLVNSNAAKTGASLEAQQLVSSALQMLTDADLRAQLWRWAGPPSWRIQLLLGDESQELSKNVNRLAHELLQDPTTFTQHLNWLINDQAERRGPLLMALGRRDRGKRLLQPLLNARGSGWANAFSAYFAGWGTEDLNNAERVLDSLAASRVDLVKGLLHATAALPITPRAVDRIVRLIEMAGFSPTDVLRDLSSLPWDALSDTDFERLIRRLDDSTLAVRELLLWPFLRRLSGKPVLNQASRELAWSLLESTSAQLANRRGHEWDLLAARLGSSEPARLLTLIEGLLTNGKGSSSQLLTVEGAFPLAWRTLKMRARTELVHLLLRLEMRPDSPVRVGWELERILNPVEDAALLLDFAREFAAQGARVVATVLDAGHPGFWSLAQRLLIAWGDDEGVRDALLRQVASGAWVGSEATMVAARLESARALLASDDPKVSSWAREVVALLTSWHQRADRNEREEWIWDYRIRRAEFEDMVRAPDSRQRLWAIGRLLKDAAPERVRELLSPQEILDALPKLPELDEMTRRKWTTYARHLVGD